MGEVCKLKNIIYVYIDSRCHPLITSLSKALFSTEQQSMVYHYSIYRQQVSPTHYLFEQGAVLHRATVDGLSL